MTKIENRDSKFCAEFNADSKTALVFLLALIVFDFYSFEDRKTNFSGDTYKHIYIVVNSGLLGLF